MVKIRRKKNMFSELFFRNIFSTYKSIFNDLFDLNVNDEVKNKPERVRRRNRPGFSIHKNLN